MNGHDKAYLSRVSELGCIVCFNLGFPDSPAEIHHLRYGQGASQRADNEHVIPLCPTHHRTGGYGVAFHAGQIAWEKEYGTELELYKQTLCLLGAK